jgi:methyl-accepting chemotaxis protein
MLQCSNKRSIRKHTSLKEQNMSAPKKSTVVKPEAVEDFIPLYTKNVKRLADLQKKSLEIAAEQNAEFIDSCKKAFHFVPETPGLFLFDVLGQAFEQVVETQKGAINLAVEQSDALANLAQERGGSAAKVAEGVTALFKQTVEQTVAAQKKALEYYSEQHKTAYETAKKQFRFSNPAAEAFQSGLDVLIETQKTMLDIASKPLKRGVAA